MTVIQVVVKVKKHTRILNGCKQNSPNGYLGFAITILLGYMFTYILKIPIEFGFCLSFSLKEQHTVWIVERINFWNKQLNKKKRKWSILQVNHNNREYLNKFDLIWYANFIWFANLHAYFRCRRKFVVEKCKFPMYVCVWIK